MSTQSCPLPERDPPSVPSSPPPTEHLSALPVPTLPTSTPLGTAAITLNPRRLAPPCWSHDETVAVIDAYRDKWYMLRRVSLRLSDWEEVADTVAQRCPMVTPAKTAVQCRHKIEKLRKRYRTEMERARSMPVRRRFVSSWVHFKRMDAMEKGPIVKLDDSSDSPDEEKKVDDEEEQDQEAYNYGFKNGSLNSKSIHRNGLGNSGGRVSGSGGGSSSRGFGIRIPTGVSTAQPGPRLYWKMDQQYGANPNSNASNHTSKGGSGSGSGHGLIYGTRILKGFEETRGKSAAVAGKRERDVVTEMVSAIKVLGSGLVKMEQMKMELERETETMRAEMEMKRTQMTLESHQRILEGFAKVVSERKKKKAKRRPSPESFIYVD